MCLHVTRKALLVYRLVALRTCLLFKCALRAIRVARTVPFLMLIETGAIELSLAMPTDPSKFELWFRRSRAALSTSARMVAMPMVMRVPTTFHLYTRGLEGALPVASAVSIEDQKKETPSGICFLRRENAVSYGCALASAKKQAATVAVTGCGSVAVVCCRSVAAVR